jgi:hypothetical protein
MADRLVLIHIPKTAGTMLRSVLADVYGRQLDRPEPVIGIDEPAPGLPYFEGLTAAAAARMSGLFAAGKWILSGHYRYRDIRPVLGDRRPEVMLLTYLREPVRRTLSDYFYSSSSLHPGRDDFLRLYPTFDDYARNAGEMNKQLDYLRPFEGAPLDETIENALQNLDFIGLTESFDTDTAQLLGALGARYAPMAALNVGPRREEAEEAYRHYHAMLEDILAPEIALYAALASRRQFRV